MAKKERNRNPFWIDRDILRSNAYRTLKRVRSYRLIWDFYARRQMVHIGVGKTKKWLCTNNGEIVFTYSEAVEMKYTREQFNDAKRELVEHGFLIVPDPGGTTDGDTAKYGISERWRKYGTKEFIEKTIPKDTRKDRGWGAYHAQPIEIKCRNLKIKRRKRSKKK